MDLKLRDRVVLVTSGVKGIGAAIVRFCAQGGDYNTLDRDAPAG